MAAIAGIFGVDGAAETVLRMLQGMQHRGQEAAGIASYKDGVPDAPGTMHDVRGFGLVDHVFEQTDFNQDLPGRSAIGHIRRAPCTARIDVAHMQPFTRSLQDMDLAIVHSGRLTNGNDLRARFGAEGAIFATENDAETILHAAARATGDDFLARYMDSFRTLKGAWTTLLLGPGAIIAAVDPLGYRPLVMAPYKGGIAFASETRALDLIDALPWTTVEPGTMIVASANGVTTHQFTALPYGRRCSFDLIYFACPDSDVFSVSSQEVRSRLGTALAECETVTTDLVSSVPDSSNAMASAYAHALGVPLHPVLVKSHYMGRVSGSLIRRATEFGIRMKLGVSRSLADGRDVTVIDDSLVHGASATKVVRLLRRAGARKVHLRIASPPTTRACPYGVNEPDQTTLAATGRSTEEVRELVGADSLRYLTISDLYRELGPDSRNRYCTECFGGPAPLDDPPDTP